ncbi:uncharacterized protein LOC110033378 [Phalaenopsis equestris]|uniref:uncharacterized protein LOC110033378 n=1 Tax=Phalaenopsis equestris TaxID=78828 RepID=UPI0009E547F8|nr:uncharacterized protein LOC110033378 [Phalaenopsis equestris]
MCNDPVVKTFLRTVVHNEQETYESYCVYAHHIGFSVMEDHSSYWPNSKNIKNNDFICGKDGHKKESNPTDTVKFRKADMRTRCQIMVRNAIDVEGIWKVKKFIGIHNHPLAKSGEKHLMCSSRKISELNANLLRSMTRSGIRATDAYNFMATEVGVENLECMKGDSYNFIQRERRERIEQGDVNSLIQLFMKRQAKDTMFA